MAIYHFSAKVISRAAGSSALAAAAYRSASRLHDERLGRAHDFTNKAGVVHSDVLLPDGAPDEWRDRERLWNAVEAAEKRVDAQLAREVEFAIPRELTPEQGIALSCEFVRAEFVSRGMVADLNVHWDLGEDGHAKPHAHVMLTMRSVGDDGEFGSKVRDWNRTELLQHWRERWAGHVNQRLVELDIDASVDHRSLAAQGIDLEPQHKIGPAAARMAGQGLTPDRVDEHREIARANGDKLLANPALALDAITHGQATFTTRDLAMFMHRHSDGKEQFDGIMAAVRAAPELVRLGRDGRGDERFTSRAMLDSERRLERATAMLEAGRSHGVSPRDRDVALARSAARGLVLSGEQRRAFEHVTRGEGLSVVIGYAGTGKSAMLGVAREAWESAGHSVRGAALSGIAAENLENGSGIASRTIASLEHQWAQGRELLTHSDVLVIDEAGLIGTRQMERVIGEAERRGAKVVLVGDPEQLQVIEAGAAFRSIAERHHTVEITAIRRQREEWQRDATRALATGRTGEAIGAYQERGHLHAAETREHARAELIERWDEKRQASPNASRIILTHTNDEVQALNGLARERLRRSGELGDEVAVSTTRGPRLFAPGDRVMFLANERSLGVKNGTMGNLESVSAVRMTVLLDDGRNVAFDVKDCAALDHGYAATVHKAQGVTVDRAYVLATPGLDRHAAYVALSRHRDRVDLHYGRDDFADQGWLVRALSRERAKDMASDYTVAPTGTEIRLPRVPEPQPSFTGLKLGSAPQVGSSPERTPLDRAVERFARATADTDRVRASGHQPLPHQRLPLERARRDLDALRPEGARDLAQAFASSPRLVDEAVKGRTAAAIRAMALEAEIRSDLTGRADRFVSDWQQRARHFQQLRDAGEDTRADRVRDSMTAMAKSLHRDPQLESLLRQRVRELGISTPSGASLSHDLRKHPALSRGRGLGL